MYNKHREYRSYCLPCQALILYLINNYVYYADLQIIRSFIFYIIRIIVIHSFILLLTTLLLSKIKFNNVSKINAGISISDSKK